MAILLVIVSHMGPSGFYFGGGSAGVTLFFVLSGFLITSLLLEEHSGTGRVDLRAFYVRRARRLLPALLVFTVVAVAVGAATFREAVPTLLYVGNYPGAFGAPVGALAHTWSLAVEEQFYLLWPVLLILGLRAFSRRLILILTLVLAAASTCERLLLWHGMASAPRVYGGLDTRADALLLGCAVAMWFHGRPASARKVPHGTVAGVVACVASLGVAGSALFTFTLLPVVVAAGSAALVVLVTRGDYAGWLTWRPLRVLGQRSYALYLWHVPIVQTLRHDAAWPWWSAFPLLVVAGVLTMLSWRYVEEPFLRRRALSTARPVTSTESKHATVLGAN